MTVRELERLDRKYALDAKPRCGVQVQSLDRNPSGLGVMLACKDKPVKPPVIAKK